jgi:MATE family multidrug resistance protein
MPTATLRTEIATLARLAWPVILGQLAMMSMSVVDALMVGRLDAAQMAAVTIGGTWYFGVLVLAFGTLYSLDPLFSQAFGARDEDAGGGGLRHGLAMVAAMTPVAMAAVWLAPWALEALGQPAEVIPVASRYARIAMWAVPGVLTFSLLKIFLQARGEMRAATVAILVANVANALLDYAFVFGRFGAPQLGAAGAAIATVGCSYVQLAVVLGLSRASFAQAWSRWSGRVSIASVLQLTRRGIPMGLQMATEVWAFQVAGFLSGRLGTEALASHGVVLNLSSLSFLVPLGVAAAAATRVGNLIGAGERWGKAAKAALVLGVGAMSLSALTFATVPTAIAGLYTTQPSIIALAASVLPVAACFQLFDGTQAVCFGILRGAGDTRLGAVANLAGYWLVGLPIGAWLAFQQGYGLHGLWAGLAISLAVVAAILLLRLRWTHRRGGFRIRLASQPPG